MSVLCCSAATANSLCFIRINKICRNVVCNIYAFVLYFADNPRQFCEFCSLQAKRLLGSHVKKPSSFVVGYPGCGFCLLEGKVGLHHVTVSHHLCKTVKYRVWKARVGVVNDNFASFVEVLNGSFNGLVRGFLENCIIN